MLNKNFSFFFRGEGGGKEEYEEAILISRYKTNAKEKKLRFSGERDNGKMKERKRDGKGGRRRRGGNPKLQDDNKRPNGEVRLKLFQIIY